MAQLDCTPSSRKGQSNCLSATPGAPSINESENEFVHRLVQDENAKTILLNVPLDTTSTGKF